MIDLDSDHTWTTTTTTEEQLDNDPGQHGLYGFCGNVPR